MITSFHGEHAWLSNFYPAPVVLDRETYPTVEHAYQAAKTQVREERELIRLAPTPGRAKRLGRKITLRPNWEQLKLGVMEALLRQKFAQPELAALLLATGDVELREENTWGDRFWGICQGEGENHLGRLLMQIRAELRERG